MAVRGLEGLTNYRKIKRASSKKTSKYECRYQLFVIPSEHVAAPKSSMVKSIAMHTTLPRHAPNCKRDDSLPPSTTKISANNANRGIAEADVLRAAGFPEGPLPFPCIARCWKAFVRRLRSIDDFERAIIYQGRVGSAE